MEPLSCCAEPNRYCSERRWGSERNRVVVGRPRLRLESASWLRSSRQSHRRLHHMMIRRHVKFLVLSAALVLALPVVASAQMSRVEGMAIQGDYIKDWSGIFTYTSQVANVGNLVYGELGNVNSPPFTFDRSV